MNEHAVGIDVSKKKLDVCIAAGHKIKAKAFPNTAAGHTQLMQWLAQRDLPADAPVVLEATGPYSEAAELALWEPPSLAIRELRALVDRLQALIDMRQQELNRLEALSQGRLSNVTAMVEDHLAWLNRPIQTIQPAIDDHIDNPPKLKHDAELMQRIPGIGQRASAQFLAYIGDVRRFKNAKALATLIGVTPRQKQSGMSIHRRTMISRAGHVAARKALYMPGLVAKRYNPTIITLAKRLEVNGLAPKAIVGASMRKLVHLI